MLPSSWFEVVGVTGHARPKVMKDENDKSANPKNARVFRTKLCVLCCTRLRIDRKVDFPRHLQTHCGMFDDSSHVPCPYCYTFSKRDKMKKHIETEHPGSSSQLYDNEDIVIKSYTNETDHMDLTVPPINKRPRRKTHDEPPKTLAEALNVIAGGVGPQEEDVMPKKADPKPRKRKAVAPGDRTPRIAASRKVCLGL